MYYLRLEIPLHVPVQSFEIVVYMSLDRARGKMRRLGAASQTWNCC